jgi:ribonuclease P protein component
LLFKFKLSKEEIKKIKKEGKVLKLNFCSIYYLENKDNIYKILIVVPKKIGKATLRNKVKRRFKSAFQKIMKDNTCNKFFKILIYPEKNTEKINFLNLYSRLKDTIFKMENYG